MSFGNAERHIQRAAVYYSNRFMNCRLDNFKINCVCVHQPIKIFCQWKTTFVSPHIQNEGVLKKVIKKLGWLNHSRSKLKRIGYYLYETVPDGIDYSLFFEEFDMEDTFFSWFLITELHVWLVMVRVMAEANEGRYVRNAVVEAMWSDVSTRCRKLGPIDSSNLKVQLTELSEQFQAAIIGYDEGLQSNDTVLASAIWRRFFQQKCSDPVKIEKLVQYVRMQVQLFDDLPPDKVLISPSISWIPLSCTQENMSK